MSRRGDWVQVFTGRRFWPLDPRVEDIDIRDIARSLSNKCRFLGHLSDYYSVAQHSVSVSESCDTSDALWGLLHDGAEAYLCDVPTPLKYLPEFAFYREAELAIMRVIADCFDLHGSDKPESVRVADLVLRKAEAKALKCPLHPEWAKWLDNVPDWQGTITPLPPRDAELLFLNRFDALMKCRDVA